MSFPIIDVHHHIVSTALQKQQRAMNIEIPSFIPKWTPTYGLEKMDLAGFTYSILSAPSDLTFVDQPTANRLAREVNEEMAEYIRLYPKRYGAFATLPMPDAEGTLKEVEYALDTLKLDGVSMLSSYQGQYLSDPKYTELLEELNRRKTVVFLHPIFIKEHIAGLSPALLEGTFDTTRAATTLAVHDVFARFPDIRFILPHTGGMVPYIKWRIALAVFGHRNGANKVGYHMDPTREDFDREIAKLDGIYYDATLNLGTLQKLVDPSRILFGADIPWVSDGIAKMQRELVLEEAAALGEGNVRAIAYENAFRLFPRVQQALLD